MPLQVPYQGRKEPTKAPAPAPQPVGVSMIDHLRSLGQLPGVDASWEGNFTDAERQSAREIKQLLAEDRFGIGQIIPHRLMPLVFDHAIPEDMKEMQGSVGGSTLARLAQKIDGDVRASLATDAPVTRRGLSTDQAPRPRNDLAPHNRHIRSNMSYQLSRVMGDHVGTLPEDLFDSKMILYGIRDITERISLKTEAMGLGLMRPCGTVAAQTYHPGMLEQAMTYQPGQMSGEIVENDDGTTTVNLRGKVDKETRDKWREMLTPKRTTPAKGPSGEGLTLKASTDQGFAAYDKTGIWVKDSHLDTL